jgi:glutamate racemase
LIPKIKEILPGGIRIIDSGEAVARQTQNVLREKVGLAENRSGSIDFYTNGDTKVLSDILENRYHVVKKDF